MANIIKFPVNDSQREKNKQGKNEVPCIISERWMSFSEESSSISCGEAFFISIMTRRENGEPKKICDLAVTKEELLAALAHVRPKD